MPMAPASPVKLPPYSGPKIEAGRPPSPPVGFDINAGLNTPVGCELRVHNVLPTKEASPKEIVLAAIDRISKADSQLAEIPVTVQFRNDRESFCAIRLSSEIASFDPNPRPDLLSLWMEPLRQIGNGWHVSWAATPLSREKALWVIVSGFNRSSPSAETVKKEVEKAAKITIDGFFPHGKDAVALVSHTLKDAQTLIERKSIKLPSWTETLYFNQARFIWPDWPFELVCYGAPNDHYIQRDIDAYFMELTRDESGNTRWHRSRLEDDQYLVLFKDWESTLKVLRDPNFAVYFRNSVPTLTPPQLLYIANSSSSRPEPISRTIRQASNILSSDLQNIHRRLDQLAESTERSLAAQDRRIAAVGENVRELTGVIGDLSVRVHNQGRALALARTEMFNLERRQILQRRIDRLRDGMASMDQLGRAAATQELSAMETELNKLHNDAEVLGPAILNLTLSSGNEQGNPASTNRDISTSGQTNTSGEEIITINSLPPTPSQNQPTTPRLQSRDLREPPNTPRNSSPTPEGSQEAAHRMMLPSPAATPLKRSAVIETPKGIRRVRLKLPQTQPAAEDGPAMEDEDVNMESTDAAEGL